MTDNQLGQMLVDIAFINHKLSDEHFLKAQTGDVLSYTGLKLAAMKASIIELKESAHKTAMDSEIEMDKQKALAYKRAMADSNATAAKDLKYADEEYIEARKKYVKDKVQYEKLKSITADTHDVIDSIKSRVIDLQGARKDEGLK